MSRVKGGPQGSPATYQSIKNEQGLLWLSSPPFPKGERGDAEKPVLRNSRPPSTQT